MRNAEIRRQFLLEGLALGAENVVAALDDLEDPAARRRIQQIVEEIRSSGAGGPRSAEEIEKEVTRMMENYI